MKMLDFFREFCHNINGELCNKEGGPKMNAVSLSNYVISLFEERKVPVTNLKLQKVLYYIQGYFYKHFGKAAFSDELYNWQYGPVVPVVYYEYNDNGSAPLKSRLFCEDPSISDNEKKLIVSIVDKCAGIATSRLVSMTHSENPWKSAGSGNVIEKNSIEAFFKYNDPLGIQA